MNWINENPVAVFMPAVAIVVLLALGYVRTKHKAFLAGAAVVALAGLALFVLNRNTVTERDRVENVLRQIAALIEQNRIAEAMEFASSDAAPIRAAATAELSRYEFGEIDIKQNLEIEVVEGKEPKEATARFNATVYLKKDPSGFASNRRIARYVEVYFRKDGEDWKVTGYTHREPTFGLKKKHEE